MSELLESTSPIPGSEETAPERSPSPTTPAKSGEFPKKSTLPLDEEKKSGSAENSDSQSSTSDAPKKRKSVGFAPEPEEDLKAHHKYLEERKKEKLKSNPFWKMPAELAYLENRRPDPKPLPTLPNTAKPRKPKKFDDMKDLPTRAVKEISTVNKNNILNFHYHEVDVPVGADRILVDVKFVSLSSLDLSKIKKYLFNMSNTRVGVGYDYVGEIINVGANYVNDPDLKVGTFVFGVTNPDERKGALQTLVIINPRDVIIPITTEELGLMTNVDINLSFSQKSPFLVDDDGSSSPDSALLNEDIGDIQKTQPAKPVKKDPFEIDDELPPLARFCTFASQFCRAKQALSIMDPIFAKTGHANILINGADTGLGYTIVQILGSEVYREVLESLNVILVVLDGNEKPMKSFVANLGSGGMKKFHVVTFDMENGESLGHRQQKQTTFKKIPFFASEILECMFDAVPEGELVSSSNINEAKLDLFVDIIGSKKMFQKSFDIKSLDEGNFPFKARIAPGSTASSLLGGAKEPLFTRILKPKALGSAYVSYCKFTVKEPSYQVDNLVAYGGMSMFDPWSTKWGSGFANLFVSSYNYHERLDLEIRSEWIEQALQLVLKGELKMKVDEYVDWRSNFRKYVDIVKDHDGQVVFKIETF